MKKNKKPLSVPLDFKQTVMAALETKPEQRKPKNKSKQKSK
jgi:hypothetical protein